MRFLRISQLAIAVAASMAGSAALASDFDGSKALVCASLEAFECKAGGDCIKDTVDGLKIPQFFWIDFAAKTVGERGPDGTIRTSAVTTASRSPDGLILQGVQDRLGWTGSISSTSGKMSLTASSNTRSVVVFGACTPVN